MRVLKDHPKSVIGLAFSPDGRFLASGSNDGSSLLFDTENDYKTRVLRTAHNRMPTYSHQLQFSADGRSLVGLDSRTDLRVWNTADGSLRATLLSQAEMSPLTFLACSPASSLVLALKWALPDVKLPPIAWNLDTCEEVPFWRSPSAIYPITFDPTGTLLACGDGVIRNVADGKEVRRIAYPAYSRPVWHGGPRPLLAAVCGRAAFLFDPETGEQVAQVGLERLEFQACRFTPDGRLFVTVSNERTAKIWDTATWRLSETLDWRVGKLKSWAISPDGMRAAAGSERGRIVIWDLD